MIKHLTAASSYIVMSSEVKCNYFAQIALKKKKIVREIIVTQIRIIVTQSFFLTPLCKYMEQILI